MTDKKTSSKTGKKSQAHGEKLLVGFMAIYRDGGTSIIDAANKMKTSYDTARQYYLKCADIIAEANHVKNETWLDKRSRVINRAMEGITQRKNDTVFSKIRLGSLLALEYGKYRKLSKRGEILNTQIKELEKQIEVTEDKIELKELFKERTELMKMHFMEGQTFTATVSQITYIEKQFNEIQQSILALQEKYDILDAMPPAVQILQAELEIYLDKKKESELRTSIG